MSQKSTISTLPSTMRLQLQQNRVNHPEWSLDDHVSFLGDNGVQVSRSALHRWFQGNPLSTTTDLVKAKTAALEAATLVYKGDSKQELLTLAEQMLIWINSP